MKAKAIDFYHIHTPEGKEKEMPKETFPVHFYPDENDAYDRIGNYIGEAKIENNKLILT